MKVNPRRDSFSRMTDVLYESESLGSEELDKIKKGRTIYDS